MQEEDILDAKLLETVFYDVTQFLMIDWHEHITGMHQRDLLVRKDLLQIACHLHTDCSTTNDEDRPCLLYPFLVHLEVID